MKPAVMTSTGPGVIIATVTASRNCRLSRATEIDNDAL
jgi:hypothetical protein